LVFVSEKLVAPMCVSGSDCLGFVSVSVSVSDSSLFTLPVPFCFYSFATFFNPFVSGVWTIVGLRLLRDFMCVVFLLFESISKMFPLNEKLKN